LNLPKPRRGEGAKERRKGSNASALGEERKNSFPKDPWFHLWSAEEKGGDLEDQGL